MGHKDREYRDLPLETAELRVEGRASESRAIRGYAVVFDARTTLWPGYDEVVRRGAFTKTLREADVVGLFNHDPNLILGRRSAGTLTVEEDERGLTYRIPVDPEDEVSRRVARKVDRREVVASSFAFRAIKAPETMEEDGTILREVTEAALIDVSPVTYPAYNATTAQLRSALQGGDLEDGADLVTLLRRRGMETQAIRGILSGAMEAVEHPSAVRRPPRAILEAEVALLESLEA